MKEFRYEVLSDWDVRRFHDTAEDPREGAASRWQREGWEVITAKFAFTKTGRLRYANLHVLLQREVQP